jgi:hypothetical protein
MSKEGGGVYEIVTASYKINFLPLNTDELKLLLTLKIIKLQYLVRELEMD